LPKNLKDQITDVPNILSTEPAIQNYNVDLNTLKKAALEFSIQYYGKLNLSRKDATELQQNITKIITSSISKEISKIVIHNNTLDEKTKNAFKSIINFCNDPFEGLDTEYKFLNTLQTNDFYEKSNIITLDNTIQNVVLHNVNTVDEKKTKGVILPLKFQFRKYFEAPDVFDSFMEHHNSLNTESDLTNFINTQLWKDKIVLINKGDSILIPYFLYFDDFEISNPLGSHSSSVLGVYYSFPSAPNFLRYSLNSIFVAALFNTKDVKSIGNDKTFFKLVEEINELENIGININLSGKIINIKFVLGLVVGDNLGINSVLGFSRSFSSTYFCRFCVNDKKKTQTMATEDHDSLRNRVNYNEHVNKNDLKQTGISEYSIFNSIKSFHVVENFSVDIMHDIFEGVAVYNMCHLITNFIRLKYFTLETLNIRKKSFNYGESEIGNMSPSLKFIKSNHLKIKMSSREMQSFVHFFPLLVGHLVPENDQYWLFLINFVELIDLLLLSKFNDSDISKLNTCIAYHNYKYVELFNDTLKPKHHLLTHYCNIIRKSGPLKFLWSYPFESKHKQLKSYCKNINSRVNIPVSLSIKYSINFAELILNFKTIKWYPLSAETPISLSKYFSKIELLFSSNDLISLNNYTCYSSISYYNTIYKTNYILTSFTQNNTVLAYKLKEVLCFNDNIFFLCETLNIVSHKKHFMSYVVSHSLPQIYVLKNIKEFMGPPIHLYELPTKETVLRLKHYF